MYDSYPGVGDTLTGVSPDPPQRNPGMNPKTKKRIIGLLIVCGLIGGVQFCSNQPGLISKFAPNIPIASEGESTENDETKVQEASVQSTEETDTFQPVDSDLEIVRDEFLSRSIDETKLQVTNLSEAVAQEFLLEAKTKVSEQPTTIELELIKKLNFLTRKLDGLVVKGELTGNLKQRREAAEVLFEVWGCLAALEQHWKTSIQEQPTIKFTTVNLSILAQESSQLADTAMKLRMLTYEQQKRIEAREKQLIQETQKQEATKNEAKTTK